MKIVHKALAPLASLEAQNRYIINGTKENYLLPEDLLNSAINVLFEQKAVKLEESKTLQELREAIRACEVPQGMSPRDLVSAYAPWVKVRDSARKYLSEIGFDLRAWEEHEL